MIDSSEYVDHNVLFYSKEDTCEQWFREFESQNKDDLKSNIFIMKLVIALINDRPLGQDASFRLASWLYVFLLSNLANQIKKFPICQLHQGEVIHD